MKGNNNSSSSISFLLDDVIPFLLDYLDDDEKLEFILVNKIFTNRFIKSTRKISKSFSELKNIPKREKVLTLIEDPSQQLDLRVYHDVEDEVDLSPLQSVNRFEGLFGPGYRQSFRRIHEMHLIIRKGERNTLNFIRERSLETGEASWELKDLTVVLDHDSFANHDDNMEGEDFEEEEEEEEGGETPFPYISNLSSLQLIGIIAPILPSQYGTLYKLSLFDCFSLEDVSAFGNIPHFTLVSCHKVKDIRALRNNHTITIQHCDGIEDYSQSFENSVIIKIYRLRPRYIRPPSIYSLNRVRSLTAEGPFPSIFEFADPSDYLTIPQLTGFQRLVYLCLKNNDNITSVAFFGSIRILELRDLRNLTSLEGLGKGNQKVIVEACNRITDFSPLRFVNTVEILKCNKFKNAAEIDHSRNVTVQCPLKGTMDLKPLASNVQHLSLIFETESSFSVKELENIPIIEVSFTLVIKSMNFSILKELLLTGNHQKIIFHANFSFYGLAPFDQLKSDSYDQYILFKKGIINYIQKKKVINYKGFLNFPFEK